MKTISITGCTGFVGSSLKKLYESKGLYVTPIKREDLQNIDKLTKIIEKSDYIVNLAGANIINRWSESYKKILYSSRIDTTKALIKAMGNSSKKPEVFISTSAVGIYKNEGTFDEDSTEYASDFLAKLCKEWEDEAQKANNLGIRTAIFRFGIVLGKNGGALKKMVLPFKLGLGGTIGSGYQNFSFIHITDLLNAYIFVFENENCSGIFNLTAPNPTTNLGLTLALGKSLNRPTVLPVPEFMLNLIFGEGSKVLTTGQCVKPKKLQSLGFSFSYENIEETIENLVK